MQHRGRHRDLTGAEPRRRVALDGGLASSFHPDGRHLAVACRGKSVILCDLQTGSKRDCGPKCDPDCDRLAVAVHPTEPVLALALCSARQVQIRRLSDGAVLHKQTMSGAIGDIAWHPSGQLLAVSDEQGRDIHFVEYASLQPLRTVHGTGRSCQLAFDPSGDRLAAYSWDRELQVFDTATGKLLFRAPARVPMLAPRFSRDGRRLACDAADGRLRIWEVGLARIYRTLPPPGEAASAPFFWADIGPDNRLLAVSRHNDGIHLLDLDSGQPFGKLPGGTPAGMHEFPHFLPEPRPALVTGGPPGLLRWPITRDGSPSSLQIGPPEALAAIDVLPTTHSQDGRLLTACAQLPRGPASAGGWIVHTDPPSSCLWLKGQNLMNIAISADGHRLATLLQPAAEIQIWDLREVQRGKAGTSPVKELPVRRAFHPRFSLDGRWLCHSGEPGQVFAVDTWKPVLSFVGRGQLSPDSRLLAVETGKGVIRLIDIESGRDLAWLEDPVQDVAEYHLFTPDGTRLVTLGKGRECGIHVWDLRLLRAQLKELDLDWAAPDYPPPRQLAPPMRVQIDPGR